MAIKLVATDLDDTLLRRDLTISERTVQTVQEAVKRGVVVTVATGRMYCSALLHARRLGVNVPLITYNGALIRTVESGETLYKQTLEEATAAKVLAVSREKGWFVQSYREDVLHVPVMNDWVARYAARTVVEPVVDGDAFYENPGRPHKLLLIASPEEIPAMQAEVRRLFGNELHVTSSKPQFLELVHPQASKGVALAFLADYYGIRQDEVMAIGDSNNDMEMIRYAGLGVAVANAVEEVRLAAQAVTASHQEDGVAEAIERFVLNAGR